MKRITKKQRGRDVFRSLKSRSKNCYENEVIPRSAANSDNEWKATKNWMVASQHGGLVYSVMDKKNSISLILPEEMNFSTHFDRTTVYILAIRKLINTSSTKKKSFKLRRINFDGLKSISSSAALVLTAEISRWDDHSLSNLRPLTDNWDQDILERFIELGYFDLFQNNPYVDKKCVNNSKIRVVRYIKGNCGEPKHKILGSQIEAIVGKEIEKWRFIRIGLDEAVVNVVHHAYPDIGDVRQNHKNWYLTGAYDTINKDLKISFYDQGIGIPKSLPASGIWENILGFTSTLPIIDRKKDEVLLKAAVQIDRSSTGDDDRGKGLPDMLEFIKMRGNGYISILSGHGLYKFSIRNGKVKEKTVRRREVRYGGLDLQDQSPEGEGDGQLEERLQHHGQDRCRPEEVHPAQKLIYLSVNNQKEHNPSPYQ